MRVGIAIICAFTSACSPRLESAEPRHDAGTADAGRPCVGVTTALGITCSQLGGALLAPRDVWETRDGSIYVTELGAGRLVRLDGDRFVPVATGLGGPIGVREAADGTLIVSEEGAHTVARIDPKTGTRTELARDLGNVTYITLDAAGFVFASSFDDVVATGTGRVTRIDPKTGAVMRYVSALNVPEGLFVENGALFVADWQLPSTVRRFEPGGTMTIVASDLEHVYGLLPDGAGGMFIGDHRGRVLRQRADGTREVIVDRIGRPGGFARSGDALLIAEFVDFGAKGRLLRVEGVR